MLDFLKSKKRTVVVHLLLFFHLHNTFLYLFVVPFILYVTPLIE